jgi:glycosyltransferase involved in cell wall biosynthesis
MKISVVMATYNGAKYLEQQIQSILNQTLKPNEFIVCDDGSTDETAIILEKYAQQGKLSYVVNSRQLGLIANFKKAVALASNNHYTALSDQDDVWLPEKLEKSAQLLRQIDNPAIPCMIYSDLILVDENNTVLNTSFRNERGQMGYQYNLETLLLNNFVNGCTTLFNPELKRRFSEIPDNVLLNHDSWMALLSFTFGRSAYIPLSLVRYRKHESNASITGDVKAKSRYHSIINEFVDSIKGQKTFLSSEFETAQRFYNCYAIEMTEDKRQSFKKFLSIQHKPYIFKKLFYRKMLNKFRLR